MDAILARYGRLRLWQAVLLRRVFLEAMPVFVMGKELLSRYVRWLQTKLYQNLPETGAREHKFFVPTASAMEARK